MVDIEYACMKQRLEIHIEESLKQFPSEKAKEVYDKIKQISETRVFPENWYEYDHQISDFLFSKVEYDRNYNFNSFSLREYYTLLIGYFIITNNFLKELSNYINGKRCLEVMSGNGSLSYGLRNHKVDIIPTDNISWDIAKYDLWLNDIENIDAISAVEKYGKDVDFIICSWPPMGNDNIMYKLLLKMREINPNCKLIYIGEDNGGCCADDEFFEIVNYIEDESFKLLSKYTYQWHGIHDYIYLMN